MERSRKDSHLFLITDALSIQNLQNKRPEFAEHELSDPMTSGRRYLTDAQLFWYNNDKEKAAPSFLKAEKLIYKAFDKEPLYAMYKLCEVYYRMEFYERVLQLFRDIPPVEEVPAHILDIVNNSLRKALRNGSVDYLKNAKELLQYYPAHWASHSNLGLANYYISQKFWKESLYDDSLQWSQTAIDLYRKSVTLIESQDKKIIEKNAGNLYFQLGKCCIEHATNLAINSIKDAEVPEVISVKSKNIAECLAQGRSHLHKSENYGYESSELYKFLGRAEGSFSETFLAIKYFEKARTMNPNDGENLYLLYNEYLAAGNKKEATKCLWDLNSPVKY